MLIGIPIHNQTQTRTEFKFKFCLEFQFMQSKFKNQTSNRNQDRIQMLLGIPIHNQAPVESVLTEFRYPQNSNSHHSCHSPIVCLFMTYYDWSCFHLQIRMQYSQLQLTHPPYTIQKISPKMNAKKRVWFWYGSAENLQTCSDTGTYPAFKQQTVSLRVMYALAITFHVHSSSEQTHG